MNTGIVMRNFALWSLALLALSVVTPLLAAEGGQEKTKSKPHDREWVQEKTKTCVTCHGEKGVSQSANFPVIAGQYKDYLYHSLKAYRDGGRENGVMAGQVQGLSDAQLKALADYYARQDSPLHTPSLDE